MTNKTPTTAENLKERSLEPDETAPRYSTLASTLLHGDPRRAALEALELDELVRELVALRDVDKGIVEQVRVADLCREIGERALGVRCLGWCVVRKGAITAFRVIVACTTREQAEALRPVIEYDENERRWLPHWGSPKPRYVVEQAEALNDDFVLPEITAAQYEAIVRRRSA